jgi:hypothetical protein
MYTAYLNFYTAIRLGRPACDAFTTIKVGDKGYSFPFFKRIQIFNYFGSDLMTQNPGIFKIRLIAFKCMVIGSTYTDLPDLYDSIIHGCFGIMFGYVPEFSGLAAN